MKARPNYCQSLIDFCASYSRMSSLNSFKSSFRNEIITQLRDQNLKKERKYILEMVLIAVNNLYWLGISIYPNIIELFQINGFKGSSFLCDIISNITDKIRSELKGHVEWINHRTLKKGNIKDKNIIICFLLFTYREHFINYLKDYLLSNKQNQKEKIGNLISNLQKIIDDGRNNYKKNVMPSINLKKLAFENELSSKKQIIQKRIIDNQNVPDDKHFLKELDEFSDFDNDFSFY